MDVNLGCSFLKVLRTLLGVSDRKEPLRPPPQGKSRPSKDFFIVVGSDMALSASQPKGQLISFVTKTQTGTSDFHIVEKLCNNLGSGSDPHPW